LLSEQTSEEEDEDDDKQPGKGSARGARRGTVRKPGKGSAGKGKGGARATPAWVTDAVEAAAKAKCGGKSFFEARIVWLKEIGYDQTKCFVKDKLQEECTNDRFPVCTTT
jgi:hypothetical protein